MHVYTIIFVIVPIVALGFGLALFSERFRRWLWSKTVYWWAAVSGILGTVITLVVLVRGECIPKPVKVAADATNGAIAQNSSETSAYILLESITTPIDAPSETIGDTPATQVDTAPGSEQAREHILTIDLGLAIKNPKIHIDGEYAGSKNILSRRLAEGAHVIHVRYTKHIGEKYESCDTIFLSSDDTLTLIASDFHLIKKGR